MKQEPDKRIVSKGEYAKAQGKRICLLLFVIFFCVMSALVCCFNIPDSSLFDNIVALCALRVC